uniref:Far upstream element binding protein 3 n=1 Tax=Neovison vison TaxID=452646 RepID=A0A8C7BHE3_NEOVI
MAELVQGQSAPVGMKAEGFVDALHRVRQIAAKIDSVPHLNNSTPLVDPSVYGYGVQKRPLDDGALRSSNTQVEIEVPTLLQRKAKIWCTAPRKLWLHPDLKKGPRGW